MNNLVLTEQSILTVANSLTYDWILKNEIPNSESYYKIYLKDAEVDVVITGNSKDRQIDKLPFIVIDKDFFTVFGKDVAAISDSLLEIHSLVIRYNQNKNLKGYIPSMAYCKDNNFVLSVGEYHIFIVVNVRNKGDFFVFAVTKSKNDKIEDYNPNYNLYEKVVSERENIKNSYEKELSTRELLLDDSYNFDLYYGDEHQQHYTFENWENVLSPMQKAFLNKEPLGGIKLRGPAGTGKTLVMELKAIKLFRENPESRILFTCHSWAVACQVSDFISNIDSKAGTQIDVFPLLTLAQAKVQQNGLDAVTMGDDSYSGKIEQLKILNSIIEEYKKSDWKLKKAFCSEEFARNFESISSENNNFTWDIMIEISCNLMANGIMPNQFDFEKYRALERRNWMIPLNNEEEVSVIFDIYRKLMEKLEQMGKITTDQVINDYINFLTTFAWLRLRKKEGYDFIFVDEMQLFNAQEKMVLSYLSKDPEKYPMLIMAMDPKQSVDQVYSDYGVTEVFNGINPKIDKMIGKTQDFCLDTAYRYTPEILNFLKHIDSSYPAMDFIENWNNNIKKTVSKQGNGTKPQLVLCEDEESEIVFALKKAENLAGGMRVAVLTLQDNLFPKIKSSIRNKVDFKIVDSLTLTHSLKYVKRNIFVSKPAYVIGLQFDAIILVGCYSIFRESAPNQSYYIRRFLSDLYLGASRAKSTLVLVGNKKAPQLPSVLQNALAKELLIKSEA